MNLHKEYINGNMSNLEIFGWLMVGVCWFIICPIALILFYAFMGIKNPATLIITIPLSIMMLYFLFVDLK